MASSPTSTAAHDRKVYPAASPSARWRTRREQESYSSKLLDALRLVRAGGSPASRDLRDVADRALAVAARGRSRWSRAILAPRSRACRRRVRLGAPTATPPAAALRSAAGHALARPPLVSRAKVLGRLVPGCRKLAFPALLAEASDYMAALEMQVSAMAALAQALQSVAPAPPPPAS